MRERACFRVGCPYTADGTFQPILCMGCQRDGYSIVDGEVVDPPKMQIPKHVLQQFKLAGSRGGIAGGSKGGKAAAARMTPEQRRERARKAALSRHRKNQE